MVLTDDDALARRARSLSTQGRAPGSEFLHEEVGYNYRLTNLLGERADVLLPVLYGLASVFGAIRAELFQGRHYGTIFGALSLASGTGLGPWVAGALYDATGISASTSWPSRWRSQAASCRPSPSGGRRRARCARSPAASRARREADGAGPIGLRSVAMTTTI